MEMLGTLAMTAGMGVMLRRAILETGIRAYDATRHRLYCRREGVGPPVPLLHGLAGCWRYWRRGLDGLREQHTLYIPDLLGFGRSPKPWGDYSIAMHTEAPTRLLDEIEGEVVVAGHSMGAILALALYARHPSRVRRIVLIGLPYCPCRDLAEVSFSKLSLMNRFTIARGLKLSLCTWISKFQDFGLVRLP